VRGVSVRERELALRDHVSKMQAVAPTKLGSGRIAILGVAFAAALIVPSRAAAQAPAGCSLKPIDYDGFHAQELSNEWVKLDFVPQLGGRLMQVTFAGHPYLFVNPEFTGKYIPPPDDPKDKWFNYGGDKIWPMPEGDEDADHWPGPIADQLDDGTYTLTATFNQDAPDAAGKLHHTCMVRLEGPPDKRTGLQYRRDIWIAEGSPEIHFRAVMTNASDHPIRWSMQSVSQYDTADTHDPAGYNKNFWAYTPANLHSAYFTQFQVRDGLANDPSFEVKDNLFRLHWLPLQNEVWLDSRAGWVAVVDRASHFAMVERFVNQLDGNYPGKATVIFYKNGPSFGLGKDGLPALHSKPGEDPFYMEAELNSPIVPLAPGESYKMDTTWSPSRAGDAFATVSAIGLTDTALALSMMNGHAQLSGTFGVFEAGDVMALYFGGLGSADGRANSEKLASARPDELVSLNSEIHIPAGTTRVELHLIAPGGDDLGSLGEVNVGGANGGTH
jgi:hypothetical protein